MKSTNDPEYNRILATHAVTFNAGKQQARNEEEKEANVAKCKIKLYTAGLRLTCCELTDLTDFKKTLGQVMYNPLKLGWIDLSRNFLSSIPSELSQLPELKSLYYHANQINDLAEILNLTQASSLRSLTLYGNGVETCDHYRLYVIAFLPQLKRVDSALITRLERDNGFVLTEHFKKRKFPKPRMTSLMEGGFRPTQMEEEGGLGNNEHRS